MAHLLLDEHRKGVGRWTCKAFPGSWQAAGNNAAKACCYCLDTLRRRYPERFVKPSLGTDTLLVWTNRGNASGMPVVKRHLVTWITFLTPPHCSLLGELGRLGGTRPPDTPAARPRSLKI
jgi:hypothetical protein